MEGSEVHGSILTQHSTEYFRFPSQETSHIVGSWGPHAQDVPSLLPGPSSENGYPTIAESRTRFSASASRSTSASGNKLSGPAGAASL